MMFPAQPNTYTLVDGERTLVQAWWYDEANNVVVALVKEGHYLRTPMAVEESIAAKAANKIKGDLLPETD